MKAAVFTEFNVPAEVAKVSDPTCPPDGVIVEVAACGVCRSDWHGWNGTDPRIVRPHVGGHEFAGRIIEVGKDVSDFTKGERVTAPFILSCGTCPTCKTGEPTVCDEQYVVGFSGWGGFAQYVAIPRADFNLVRLPEAMDFVTAAGLGCRVTTAYRALTSRGALQPGEWLAIHGTGGVGLSAVLLAKALGARVLAIDVNKDALALAEKFGADAVLDASGTDDVGAAVQEITGGGAQVSMDALGITQTFDNSISGLAKMGRHIQVGMPLGPHAEVNLKLHQYIYTRQISIIGSRGMAASGFPPLFKLVESGRFDPTALVTRRIGLKDVGETLVAMNSYSGSGISVVDDFT